MKCEISGSHTISYQSLLLSTIVLNDIHVHIHIHKQIHTYTCIHTRTCPVIYAHKLHACTYKNRATYLHKGAAQLAKDKHILAISTGPDHPASYDPILANAISDFFSSDWKEKTLSDFHDQVQVHMYPHYVLNNSYCAHCMHTCMVLCPIHSYTVILTKQLDRNYMHTYAHVHN